MLCLAAVAITIHILIVQATCHCFYETANAESLIAFPVFILYFTVRGREPAVTHRTVYAASSSGSTDLYDVQPNPVDMKFPQIRAQRLFGTRHH